MNACCFVCFSLLFAFYSYFVVISSLHRPPIPPALSFSLTLFHSSISSSLHHLFPLFTISFLSSPFLSLLFIASALSPNRSSITLHKCIFHSFYGEWDYTKDNKHASDMRLVDVWIDVSETDSIKGQSTTIQKSNLPLEKAFNCDNKIRGVRESSG